MRAWTFAWKYFINRIFSKKCTTIANVLFPYNVWFKLFLAFSFIVNNTFTCFFFAQNKIRNKRKKTRLHPKLCWRYVYFAVAFLLVSVRLCVCICVCVWVCMCVLYCMSFSLMASCIRLSFFCSWAFICFSRSCLRFLRMSLNFCRSSGSRFAMREA